MFREFIVNIHDGNIYTVRVNSLGKVMATKCEGRWPMSAVSTGQKWLDIRLQEAATRYLEAHPDEV